MKKIIKLTEKDLTKIINKVLLEQRLEQPLKIGDRGPEVTDLQQKLIDGGFLRLKNNKTTDYFGPLTQRALIRYQKSKNLKPTGEYDLATKNSLPVGLYSDPLKMQNDKPQTNPTSSKKGQPTNPQKSYKLTPRIDQELDFIKQRGLDNTPFFIYDPEFNLIYLFNKGGILVDYSQVVDGKDKQQDKPNMDHQRWCKLSGLETSPYLCTDPKTKNKKDPYYSVLANTATKFLRKGIYKINNLFRHEGYEGVGKNLFSMVDDNGKPIAAAIHGIPNLPERLEASKDLELLLKKDISSGKVPEKYLNSIKVIANANQSFGCVGVPANFIDNPNVQKLAKNARLFVMGEGKNFLVQNPVDYFDKITGDGENCVNPESIASQMSSMA
jgi:hypothetical protein